MCRVEYRVKRSYLNVTKPDQTGCLQTALWKKNTKTVLGKYMQMQILCFYHGSMGFTFYILIVLSGAQFTCWRYWRKGWRWWRWVITENYFIGSGCAELVILLIAWSLLISIRKTIVKPNYLSSKKYTDKIRLETLPHTGWVRANLFYDFKSILIGT